MGIEFVPYEEESTDSEDEVEEVAEEVEEAEEAEEVEEAKRKWSKKPSLKRKLQKRHLRHN